MLSPLMKEAVGKVENLPADQQEAIAALMLEDLASERRWDEQFAGSQDVLQKLAEEARQEHRDGKTRPLDDLLE